MMVRQQPWRAPSGGDRPAERDSLPYAAVGSRLRRDGMRHPASTKRFLAIAVLATLVGLYCVGVGADNEGADFAPVSLALGYVLLGVALINFAVNAVAGLMRDHELWRSTSFTEIIETVDQAEGGAPALRE
jgi:hypothetical protein